MTIEKLAGKLEEDPDNAEARAELKTALPKVEPRSGATSNPEAKAVDSNTLLVLAKGNLALERYDSAFDLASVAARKLPESQEAANLAKQAGIESLKKDKRVSDQETINRLKRTTSFLEVRRDLSAEDHVAMLSSMPPVFR